MKYLLTLFVSGLIFASNAIAAPLDLKLDTSKTGAPINPLIYGQFIEHLGRCIYGGIWAEMLEDRKFYFPITASYAPYKSLQDTAFPVVGASPWQIIGDAGGVTMVKEDAFDHRHHEPNRRRGRTAPLHHRRDPQWRPHSLARHWRISHRPQHARRAACG